MTYKNILSLPYLIGCGPVPLISWRGTGGRPREKGMGGVWQVGEERAGSGRKRGKVATLHNILQSKKKPKEERANKYREGTGIKGYEKWEV